MNQQKRHLAEERKAAPDNGNGAKPLAVPAEPERPLSPLQEFEIADMALVVLAFVAVIGALYLTRSILMPIFAALIIGITMRPIQTYLARYRVPGPVTALVMIALFAGAVYVISTLLVGSLTAWISQSPDFATMLRDKLRWMDRPLAALNELQKAFGGGEGGSKPALSLAENIPAILQGAVVFLTPALSELLLFVGTLVFFLLGTEKLRRHLITLFETRTARLTVVRIWNDVESNLMAYVSTVTAINLGLGVVTGVMLYLLGFPNPLAFAALAFVLNYIPYIGPAILVTVLFAVGLMSSPSLGGAVLPPLLFVAIATIEGHLITPNIIGRRLTLSPFLVFLALAFWAWLWGPLGAFLATPLLIVGLVVLDHLFPRPEGLPLPK